MMRTVKMVRGVERAGLLLLAGLFMAPGVGAQGLVLMTEQIRFEGSVGEHDAR